ncbi:MAG: peptidoglycan recognition family protein [Lachnospiraceae bacterium]|nr:peptidoglycan recognition protein family protein [Lachnospiraceae bacterium]MDD7326385.1 peptidoglycan recognition family protein [Lachnospiraceae bacterium]MDY2759905.1 peptidoglycan recognition family protein [Lachnospiraceae bacterium]
MSRLVSRRKKKKKKNNRRIIAVIAVIVLIIIVALVVHGCQEKKAQEAAAKAAEEQYDSADASDSIDVELLTPNKYSRPEIKLEKVKGIVVHYTANPGSTAMENRNYFEGLKDSHATHASSHFVIGLEGEIVQCIPTKEEAYASNERNSDTLSIECCHYAEDGKFSDRTYSSLVKLCAYLCHRFGLTQDDIIRHYDVTGKNCPKYFVEHPKAWKQFRADVKTALDNKDWNLDIIS